MPIFHARKNQRLVVTDRQFSIIIGSLLGDAYISPLGKIQFEHSEKAKEYVQWKFREMDDGHYEREKKRCIIATDGFSDDDREKLKSFLKTKFNLTVTIRKSGKIAMTQSETKKFFEIIHPYKIGCMAYKFPNPLTTNPD